MYDYIVYIILAILAMVSLNLFGKRGSKDTKHNSKGRQNSSGGSSPQLCEVSGHDHSPVLSSHPPSRSSSSPRSSVIFYLRSVGNAPGTSKRQVSSTHTAEELAPEPTSASTRLATSPESLRSADIVDSGTQGKLLLISVLPLPVTHMPHTEMPFNTAMRQHVRNAGNNLKR